VAGETDFNVFMRYEGVWNDITEYLDLSQPVIAKVGQPSEHGTWTPTEIGFTLDDEEARFNPENAESDLYRKFGMGTPIMVSEGESDSYAKFYHSQQEIMSVFRTSEVPDSTTGVYDIRIEGSVPIGDLSTWLVGRIDTDTEAMGWAVGVSGVVRTPFFTWTTNGGASTSALVGAAIFNLGDTERALRWTFEADNGAGGRTARFYTATTINGPWTLTSTVTNAGVATLTTTPAELTIGGVLSGLLPPFGARGILRHVELRDSTNGTPVSTVDFTNRTQAGIYGFQDEEGNQWTSRGGAAIVDESVRAMGEATSFKPLWDSSGYRRKVQVRARGPLARLGRATKVSNRSRMYRHVSARSDVVAYWPLEEGTGAVTQLGASTRSGVATAPQVGLTEGFWTPAAFSGFSGSDPVATYGGRWVYGAVPDHTLAIDHQHVSWQMRLENDAGIGSGTELMSCVIDTASHGEVRLYLKAIGTLFYLLMYPANDPYNVIAFDTGALISAAFEKLVYCKFWVREISGGLTITFELQEEGSLSSISVISLSPSGYTTGPVRQVRWGGAASSDIAFGHVHVSSAAQIVVQEPETRSFLVAPGYPSEFSPHRIARLMDEESQIAYSRYDIYPNGLLENPAGTELAAQDDGNSVELARKAALSDYGLMGEDFRTGAIVFRPRYTRQGQDPVFTLSSDDGTVIHPVERVTDLSDTVNHGIARISGGSSSSYLKTSGPQNSNRPEDDPEGAGYLVGEITVSLADNEALGQYAAFLVATTTTGDPRISNVTIEVEFNSALEAGIRALFPGDVVRIEFPNLPGGKGVFDFIVFGWEEEFSVHRRRFSMNLGPADGWNNIVLSTKGRLQTDGHELAGFVSPTGTAFSVRRLGSVDWITNASHSSLFPFTIEVGGEVMTVTNIDTPSFSDGFYYQTFTVTRSTNYVTKSHVAKTPVRVAEPTRLAL
jgi:hypothetical protein